MKIELSGTLSNQIVQFASVIEMLRMDVPTHFKVSGRMISFWAQTPCSRCNEPMLRPNWPLEVFGDLVWSEIRPALVAAKVIEFPAVFTEAVLGPECLARIHPDDTCGCNENELEGDA